MWPSDLGACAGEGVAAERLHADHRAGHGSVHLSVSGGHEHLNFAHECAGLDRTITRPQKSDCEGFGIGLAAEPMDGLLGGTGRCAAAVFAGFAMVVLDALGGTEPCP